MQTDLRGTRIEFLVISVCNTLSQKTHMRQILNKLNRFKMPYDAAVIASLVYLNWRLP